VYKAIGAGRVFLQASAFQTFFWGVAHNEQHSMASRKRRCPVCAKTLANATSLRLHKQAVHSDERAYKCPSCPRKFKTKGHLRQHEASHSATRHACDRCDRTYNTTRALRLHHLRDHGDAAERTRLARERLEQALDETHLPAIAGCPCKNAELDPCLVCGTCFSQQHWFCAGYDQPLPAGATFFCSRCLQTLRLPPATVVSVAYEPARLDAALALRGLHRLHQPTEALWELLDRHVDPRESFLGRVEDTASTAELTALLGIPVAKYELVDRELVREGAENASLQFCVFGRAIGRLQFDLLY
jgi:hypothetical protein